MSAACGQGTILIGPITGTVTARVFDGNYFGIKFLLSSIGPNETRPPLKFKLASIDPSIPNFLVVSPSSGTTPQEVWVAPNPSAVYKGAPGTFHATVTFVTVDQTPARQDFASITINLTAPPPPSIGAVLNSASFQPVVTPGGIVSIFGTSLGPPLPPFEYSTAGLFPSAYGDIKVTFNGIAAPLLSLSPGQINAVVPYALAGQNTANVVVTHYGQTSPAFSVPVVDTSPAIFTASQNGTGQGAILNLKGQNYVYNSADSPALAGSLITLFATGIGIWDDTVQDGSISVVAKSFTTKPVSLTIGGQAATIQYAGAAPFQSMGMLQVNALVPEGTGSGARSVVLKIGSIDNSQQNVTIAIQ
jgi:uncharacterized protein (TIGR03437 family)